MSCWAGIAEESDNSVAIHRIRRVVPLNMLTITSDKK
jgi:hypothetical protein